MHHWIQSVILHLILRPLPKQPPFFEGEFRWTSNVAGRCRFSVWTVITTVWRTSSIRFEANHTWTKLDKIKPILPLLDGTILILSLLNGTFFISTPFKWDNFSAKNEFSSAILQTKKVDKKCRLNYHHLFQFLYFLFSFQEFRRHTVFEKYQKCLIWIFQLMAFFTNLYPIKLTDLVTLFNEIKMQT